MSLASLAIIGKSIPKILPKTLKFKNSRLMFSFARPQSLFNASGTLREEGMMLCHMTDFVPKNGIIQSARAATGVMRDSVHFSVNHSVLGHAAGDWSKKKFAILMPMKGARKMAGNQFAGGIATDLYSIGSVRIPPNSVIVRSNPNLPKGKYRILNASEFRELTGLKRCRVIETSNPNFQESVDDIISKCGYELKQTDNPFIWGKIRNNSGPQTKTVGLKNFKKFNDYLASNGMKPMAHTFTPNARMENIYHNIFSLNITSNSWIYRNTQGKILVDHKKELIEALDNIMEQCQRGNFTTSFDLARIKNIVQISKTPNEAILELKKLGIKQGSLSSTEIAKRFNDYTPIEKTAAIVEYRLSFINGKSFQKSIENVNNYIANPSLENYNPFYHSSNTLRENEIIETFSSWC